MGSISAGKLLLGYTKNNRKANEDDCWICNRSTILKVQYRSNDLGEPILCHLMRMSPITIFW